MKELKLLFINSCLRKGAAKILPVGLASVMTYIKNEGYEFDLLDVDINEYDDDYIESYLQKNKYDVILYGTIVTHYKWIKWLTHTIKKHQPETLTVIGNSVAGSCYEVFMNNCPADVVVIGEGEITCSEVLDAIINGKGFEGIEGTAYRSKEGKIVKNPKRTAAKKLDDLPRPDWSLFDMNKYFDKTIDLSFGDDEEDEKIILPVSTARGCAFRCTFCHFVFWDDPYRYRSPESIVDEVRSNIEQYGVTNVSFFDDLTFAGLGQTEKLLDAILDSGLKFKWTGAIRSDLFGHGRSSYEKRLNIAKKMKESGCTGVGFSLESGDEEILKMMNKKVTNENFEESVSILREAGITSHTSVVFGYPIETKETIRKTFDMCYKNNVYPSIGFLLPLPYTGMYSYAKEHGHITDEDAFLDSITERQDIVLNMTKMTDEEIMNEIKEGGSKLNELLDLGLNEDQFVKTGGYKKMTNKTAQLDNRVEGLDPDNIQRNENDVSFNYSANTFDENKVKAKA
jgi:anaerobic magnesium-protoporphyrin IX monomethyl ester cyclase